MFATGGILFTFLSTFCLGKILFHKYNIHENQERLKINLFKINVFVNIRF